MATTLPGRAAGNDRPSLSWRNRIRRPARFLCVFAFLPWLVTLIMLAALETFLVYPAPPPLRKTRMPHGVERFCIDSGNGHEIVGWFRLEEAATRTVLYFHGNGEDVPRAWDEAQSLARTLNANVMAVEYRGYGEAGGTPSESALIADAVQALDWAVRQTGHRPDQFVLIGRSIGCGVACGVAARRPVGKLILISGFSSLVDVAGSKLRIFPVRWIMRNQYDNRQALESCSLPILMIHGTLDDIIPIRLGRKLFDSLKSPDKEFVEIAGRGHNDLFSGDFLPAVRTFDQR